jgi:hypothetical protein
VLGTTVGDVPDIVVPNKCLDVSVHAIATEANNKMLGQWGIQLVTVGETRRADEPGHYLTDFPSKLLCQLHRGWAEPSLVATLPDEGKGANPIKDKGSTKGSRCDACGN